MKLMSQLFAAVLLAPCFSFGCDVEPLTEKAAIEKGERIFTDYLKRGRRLQRTDFSDPVVTLDDEGGASVAFRRRGFPNREAVYVLLGSNGCSSVSGTP